MSLLHGADYLQSRGFGKGCYFAARRMSNDYIIFGSPLIGEEEIQAVTKTLETCWIGTGPRTHEFERAIAEYVGAELACAVGSCTAALHLSMVASGVGRGHEVVTTPLTFCATSNSVIHTGAKPVFVDVDRTTQNIDPSLIEAAITDNTRAILPVHFAGRPCDMDAIGAIAKTKDLLVIEDAAHALEARYKGRRVGSISPLTCFSFYVTKNITTGEGGMVTTNDPALAKTIQTAALHGLSADAWERFGDKGYKHYEVVLPGYKYNLTDIASSIGLVQLSKVEAWLERRNEVWARYDEAFANLPCFTPAPAEADTRHARHLYTLMLDIDDLPYTRNEFMGTMHKKGVGTGVHYRAVHMHPYYRETFGYKPEDFPNAQWISERTVSLPLSAKLTDEQVDRIIATVTDVLSTR